MSGIVIKSEFYRKSTKYKVEVIDYLATGDLEINATILNLNITDNTQSYEDTILGQSVEVLFSSVPQNQFWASFLDDLELLDSNRFFMILSEDQPIVGYKKIFIGQILVDTYDKPDEQFPDLRLVATDGLALLKAIPCEQIEDLPNPSWHFNTTLKDIFLYLLTRLNVVDRMYGPTDVLFTCLTSAQLQFDALTFTINPNLFENLMVGNYMYDFDCYQALQEICDRFFLKIYYNNAVWNIESKDALMTNVSNQGYKYKKDGTLQGTFTLNPLLPLEIASETSQIIGFEGGGYEYKSGYRNVNIKSVGVVNPSQGSDLDPISTIITKTPQLPANNFNYSSSWSETVIVGELINDIQYNLEIDLTKQITKFPTNPDGTAAGRIPFAYALQLEIVTSTNIGNQIKHLTIQSSKQFETADPILLQESTSGVTTILLKSLINPSDKLKSKLNFTMPVSTEVRKLSIKIKWQDNGTIGIAFRDDAGNQVDNGFLNGILELEATAKFKLTSKSEKKNQPINFYGYVEKRNHRTKKIEIKAASVDSGRTVAYMQMNEIQGGGYKLSSNVKVRFNTSDPWEYFEEAIIRHWLKYYSGTIKTVSIELGTVTGSGFRMSQPIKLRGQDYIIFSRKNNFFSRTTRVKAIKKNAPTTESILIPLISTEPDPVNFFENQTNNFVNENNDYYNIYTGTGTSLVVPFSLPDLSLYTIRSINDAIRIYVSGVKYYKISNSNSTPLTMTDEWQYNHNTLTFTFLKSMNGRRIEVDINLFKLKLSEITQ